MKFWDTSAVVPLCINEPSSKAVRSILTRDSLIVVWWTKRTECVSASCDKPAKAASGTKMNAEHGELEE